MKAARQKNNFILVSFTFTIISLLISNLLLANEKLVTQHKLNLKVSVPIEPQNRSEEIGSLSFTVSNYIVNPSSSLRVEVCRFGIFDMDMMGCITMPENETVDYSRTRIFHVTRSDLDRLLKRSDLTESAKVQFRFKDVSTDQVRYKDCEEHPYTILDPNAHEKRFLIKVFKHDHTSFSCSIFKEEEHEMIAEPKEEGLLGRVAHKFKDYKTWIANDAGLTFSVKNRLPHEPRLKAQVCSYKKSSSSPTCLTVGEDDYIAYNKSHVYHIDKNDLNFLLSQAEGNNIQFRFKDTSSSLGSFKPCWNEPSTHLETLKLHKGYRFEIDVNKFDHVIYYTCRVKFKD